MTEGIDELLARAGGILRQQTPSLAAGELTAYVERHYAARERYLALLETSPPPLYVLETQTLRDRAGAFRAAFENVLPTTSFYYAVKSNNLPELSACLLECGFGLDVSSGQELESALALGAHDIAFSGPGKTDAELALAVAHANRVTVLMDSFGELPRLAALAAKAAAPVRAGVRLTPDTAGLWRKFGVPLAELRHFWEEAERHAPHVQLKGIQFHVSWNLSPDAQIATVERLGAEIARWPGPLRGRIEFLDIGGGFWPTQGEWLRAEGTPEGQLRHLLDTGPAPPLAHYRLPAAGIGVFADRLGRAIREHVFASGPCRICFEPGRWICNDAMHLLVSVVDRKGPDMAITDAGTNMIGWERFESDYAPVLNLTRPALQEVPCLILGSLCTPHDVWGGSYWGAGLQPGDVLLIPDQGAYTYSLRQQFIKPVPAVAVL
ncbi:MAG: alanine racemase [Candidatus Hydrogenedentes bacterium]|nr:alanine racemase [Candidatus Hydrogenedentota bacterium]